MLTVVVYELTTKIEVLITQLLYLSHCIMHNSSKTATVKWQFVPIMCL